ncbi:magnetosome protein Mad17 [Candidatus Magnetoovum chiemensis]|nr:magnetosome protein Mad17 [Candidatus Magnetoovum chiemensis]
MANKTISPNNRENIKRLFILGLPNTGKSQIFNNLTGSYSIVANYPMSTISAIKSKIILNNKAFEIYDTPGIKCLYIQSEEDLIVRDELFNKPPDIIVQCIDANQLKQSLTLTADLIELDIPMVLILNAVDETSKKGIWIDSDKLSKRTRIPVVESIAISNRGTEQLKQSIETATTGKVEILYGDIIENTISKISKELTNIQFHRKTSLLLLLEDPFIEEYLKDKIEADSLDRIKGYITNLKKEFRVNITKLIVDKRSVWVDSVYEDIVRKQKVSPSQYSYLAASLSRNVFTGIPILFGLLFIMYFLVVDVANVIAEWMDARLWSPIADTIGKAVTSPLWSDFLIGHYGILSLGIANAIVTVLPILSVFFLFYNILEDSGYIPNLSVLTRKVFETLGLSGASIMPIVLGFGCKTMATLTTRSIHTKKERYIAIFLIAFSIPCAAQMGINTSILGKMGIAAFLITMTILLFVALTAGIVLNIILKEEGSKTCFVQELPLMRLPSALAVIKKTYYRLYWFLKEAVPVFIYTAAALFTMDKTGILDALKIILSPLIQGFLGLPISMVDALIVTMARREAAAGMLLELIEKGQLNYIQCIVAVLLTTMFVPCLANVGAMMKEIGVKQAIYMVMIINAAALAVSGTAYWTIKFFYS